MKKIIGLFIVALWSVTMLQAVEVAKESTFSLGKYGTFKFEKVNQNVYVMHGPVVEPNKEDRKSVV